ncbi:pancreatic triacylglycerol lipase-like [Haliotis rufescens]|uniref:pancreatic triacylglycerol lipase-like n=1 Tax=Haliotis rufescens TaxID=6454 RepID=UPI00201F4AE3|nr:pancreatic triacylglycerol lipase-like [Haliotis rufescens]
MTCLFRDYQEGMESLVLGIFIACVSLQLSEGLHKRSSVCYDHLGCFATDPPFFSLHRPLNFLPESPDHINVQFMLYTKHNPQKEQIVTINDSASVTSSNFDPAKPTKIAIHGYFDNGQKAWLHEVKDEYLKTHDVNVFIVDWGGGSKTLYTQATANTRVVGAIVAQFITHLKTVGHAKPEDFHLIGHSLGAHAAGYAGERIQYVGRITGLDPAEPYFQGTDVKVRLDPTDAMFVDIIHTNGESLLKLGLGMKQPCGHVDYYPNGGLTQPGCDAKNAVSNIKIEGLQGGVKTFFDCSHKRSHALFTESINSRCPFEAYKCNSNEDFNAGKCIPCSGGGCGYMGYHGDRVKPNNKQTLVKYFLKTGSTAPYCRFHYQLQITLGAPHGSRKERGDVYATLTGSKGHTEEIQLTDDHIDLTPGKSYTYVVTSPQEIGQLTKFTIRWEENAHWYKPLDWNPLNLRHPTLFISKVKVVEGENTQQFQFCGSNVAVESKTPKQLSASSTC